MLASRGVRVRGDNFELLLLEGGLVLQELLYGHLGCNGCNPKVIRGKGFRHSDKLQPRATVVALFNECMEDLSRVGIDESFPRDSKFAVCGA